MKSGRRVIRVGEGATPDGWTLISMCWNRIDLAVESLDTLAFIAL